MTFSVVNVEGKAEQDASERDMRPRANCRMTRAPLSVDAQRRAVRRARTILRNGTPLMARPHQLRVRFMLAASCVTPEQQNRRRDRDESIRKRRNDHVPEQQKSVE